MKLWNDVKQDIRTDVTWNRAVRLTAKGAKALPKASLRYAVEKVPVVEWLPSYRPRWIINDVVAGLTIGLMLIPQSLSYAKIAGIPVQYGLMSSWLPPALYALMGSTKDVSTGPTSLIGLLTNEAVIALPEYTPSQVASGMAMMMGIYGLVIGFLKLGFLLEFISLPVLSGFISAVAITIGLNQMGSLLGEPNIGTGTATQIHNVFAQLPQAKINDCAIGFTGILLITILEKAGKRWGEKNRIIWFLSITRAFLALVLYTGISYAVNHSRSSKHYLFAVVQVKGHGIDPPQVPDASLLSKLASRSVATFVGAAVEHTAIARAFGVRNNYVTDQSQELSYLGLTNFVNSFFHSMGVGGAMSRTAVNNACRVKSPLSGIITTAVVLISIFKLMGTLYWIPKATLAAIIICAVAPLVSSPKVFYRYWKTSLADWIAAMIAFWVTLFVSTEIGLAASVGFNIVYYVMRQVFATVQSISSTSCSELVLSLDDARGMPTPSQIPGDVRIFRFEESVFFPNSHRLKTRVLETIQTCHAPSYSTLNGAEADRNWSVAGQKRVKRLRQVAGITDPTVLPPINLVVFDFAKVNYIDTTAVTHLKTLIIELKKYAGDGVEVRFVGMSDAAKLRFKRAKWTIVETGSSDDIIDNDATRLYGTVRDAVLIPRRRSTITGEIEAQMLKKGMSDPDVEKIVVAHRETVDSLA